MQADDQSDKDSQPEESEDLYKIISQKLELNDIYGQVLAARAVLNELLPALTTANALTIDQVDELLKRAATNLTGILDNMAMQRAKHADDFAVIKSRALSDIDQFRGTVHL